MKATVITVSSNTNSFGYKSVIVMSKEGEAKQLLLQAYGTDTVPRKGDDVDTSDPKFAHSSELPGILPSLAKQLIKKIKNEALQTKN